MNFKTLFIIVTVTVLTFSALYAPQPLLPVLSSEFSVSKTTAALMTTFTLIPLSFAPFIYGFILESVSAKKMVTFSMFFLSLTELLIFFSKSFHFLLAIRLFQGFLIPAILTSLMTYVSKLSEAGKLQKSMSIYISATIVGGFLGRAVSGFISFSFGWRYTFLALFICILLSLFFILKLKSDVKVSSGKIVFQDIYKTLKNKNILFSYLGIFFLFSAFAGFLNFLPSRINELSSKINEFKIGLSYSGYLMGVFMSLFSVKIVSRFGYKNILKGGVIVFIFAVLIFSVPDLGVYYLNMFILCGGIFLVHSTLSGFVNRYGGDKKGILNGLYVSFYYSGGVLGSYLPGLVYENFGWNSFLFFLIVLSLLSFSFLSYIYYTEY